MLLAAADAIFQTVDYGQYNFYKKCLTILKINNRVVESKKQQKEQIKRGDVCSFDLISVRSTYEQTRRIAIERDAEQKLSS